MRASFVATLLIVLAGVASASTVSGTVKLPAGHAPDGTVVYLAQPGKTYPAPPRPALMDQRLKTFIPHVLVVQRGQTVLFPNNDIPRHNVFSPSKVHPFNLGLYPHGVTKQETFDKPGVVALLCNVHPEMSAFVVVSETPWYGMTDAQGRFHLKDVPPGHYELVVWHEGMTETRQAIDVTGDAKLDVALHKAH